MLNELQAESPKPIQLPDASEVALVNLPAA